MVCFRYIIVYTLYKGYNTDDDDGSSNSSSSSSSNNNNNNNNNNRYTKNLKKALKV